jgi:hypothetical protein
VISDDELAAIAVALTAVTAEVCHPEERAAASLEGREGSRWKLAAREPDFEIEDYRSVH